MLRFLLTFLPHCILSDVMISVILVSVTKLLSEVYSLLVDALKAFTQTTMKSLSFTFVSCVVRKVWMLLVCLNLHFV